MDDSELDEQIKAQVQEWSTNSCECFTVELVRGDLSKSATFQPEFTYPIFGDEEAIFGYQDLEIKLTFAAHDLKPHLAISYSKKFPANGEVKPTDIHEALREFLPADAFSKWNAKDALIDGRAAEFTPPGEMIKRYSRKGVEGTNPSRRTDVDDVQRSEADEDFEIWCADLSDPKARRLLENMQILVPMLIEGGSMLQLEQDWTTQRWKLFTLYNVTRRGNSSPTCSRYSLVGYGTSYRVFTFPDRYDPQEPDADAFAPSQQSVYDFLPPPETAIPNDFAPTSNPNSIRSPLDLPSRERLSQFLILPPFHKQGHGPLLYKAMYNTLTKPSNVQEFTVEDPNEAFDDLRDLCDLLYLRANDPDFAALRINTNIPADKLRSETSLPVDLIVPVETRNAIMKRTKIMQRQFDRLVEMHLLSFIPHANRSRARVTRREQTTNLRDKEFYFWRLYVKQRLYIFNRDQLAQLERQERIEKLESALDSVQEAYGIMLERLEKRERDLKYGTLFGIKESEEDPMAVEGAMKVRAKRKIVDDEEDDEEMVDAGVNGHGRKKAKA